MMMPAEKWFEYQHSYQRYGIDMKPARPKRQEPVRKKKQSVVTAGDRKLLVFLTLLIGMVCIGMIICTAYTAKVKYEINALIRETGVIRSEIDTLQVKIKQATSIDVVEQRAREELGMVYPSSTQHVYLEEEVTTEGDFAQSIKENAYQVW